MFDLAVVGGGVGGLATAALASRHGLKTVLCESHTHVGGCAGYFSRGPFTFDAGATALMGVAPGEPVAELFRVLGADLETVAGPSYRIHLPDRTFDLRSDRAGFESLARDTFGQGRWSAARQGAFWNLQEAVGSRLFRASARVPRLPPGRIGDLGWDARILGPTGLAAASTCLLTVRDVLRALGLNGDRPFRTLLAMLLQDAAQAGPETVPFANAAACLHAYRAGLRRPKGGMKAFVESLAGRFAESGGELCTATIVDHVERQGDGATPYFQVVTRRGRRIEARQVAFNLPLDLAARLLGRPLDGGLGRLERRSRAAWSAFTGYLALDRAAIADDAPLFHHVLLDYDRPIHDGNNVLISLSPAGDPGYGPDDVRVATLSTHVRPEDWQGLDREAHGTRKREYQRRLGAALERALPSASRSVRHAEYGTPRSFQRYTRRTHGAVGGPPVSRTASNLAAVGVDALGPGLWLVGDSVFPGQGTMAVVLSAARVVERITGRLWRSPAVRP